MTLNEQVEAIKKAGLKTSQFIAYKETEQGVKACPFFNKQKGDVLQFGWTEYKEPEAPKAVKKAPATSSRSKKS